jgi:deoxyribose-phosphate aldolase
MHKEMNCFDTEMTEQEVLKKVFFAIENKLEGVFVSPLMVPIVKDVANRDLQIATFVDYPYGMADTATRTHAVLSCIRKGAVNIDLMANMFYINNKQHLKFSEDIKANLEICKSNGASLRIVLEYKLYELPIVYKLCEVLADIGVQYIVPSTDRLLDDVIDNIFVCHGITKKTGLKTIINAPIHKEIQFKCVLESKCYGVRLKTEKSYEHLKGLGV